uniref:CBM-cenC domain-containing protein n=1 Tax=Odontella aurita TaxID=265563 RepID=A0A7S4MJT6_9STRA
MANAAADGRVEFRFDAGHHRRYADVDYDDISIKLIHGPIKGIVVKDAGVAGCWGGGNELVVTSHTFSQNHEQVVPLADDEPVTLIGDGKAVLNLKTALPKYPTTAVLDAEQASEVALLGRNIRFEADTDVPHKGGYLNVLRTFNVTQKIRGVDFNRFGHLDQGNRYPIHFDRLDKVPDGKIEYNLIRQSNMRCVILNGLEGVTVEGNVAYNNKGICFGTFAGREQVTITNNLAIRTRQNLDSWRTASFYIRDPRVIFKGNVAAGSDRKGIYFQPEWRTSVNYHNMPAHKRNWNPRDTALGAFENNVAHSCAEWGLVLSTYHPLGNEPSTQVFSTYRGFRNVNNAHMDVRGVALDDWYLADGRHRNLDLQWSTDIHINDMKIVAYSPTFRKQVKEQTHIWHTCKDVNEKQRLDRLIGFEVFHKRGWKDWSGYDKTTAGVVMKGVTFEGFEDTGCAASNPFYAERHREQPHFDAFLAIESMTSSTEEAVLNLCTFESLEVQDVVITDADSSMGPILTGKAEGSFSGPSSIVSDYDYMKGFAGGECTSNAGKCLAYCENTCLQFVSWEVTPYGTEDVLLVVEDVNSGKSISVPGNFEVSKNNDGTPNVYYNTFLYDMRKFSAALPAGEYTAQFVKDGQPYWPTHAYDRFERKPPCMGDGSVTVTLERPDPTLEECTELVKNGDVELGNYTHWVHVNGGVEAMEGEGVDGSYAMLNKRSHRHHGIGFYVDTRCTKLMEGHEYRITAQVRLQDANGAAVSCDPDSLDENNMCPTMWLQTKKYRQDANTIDVWNMANVAMSVRPWNMVGYTLIEGTFVVKDTIAQADSVFLWVTRGGSKHIVVDNTSIKLHYRGDVSPPAADAMPLAMMAPIPKAECPKEFLMNKGFELGTTEYWRNRGYGGKGKLEIVPGGADGTGHALKMTNVGHYYNGPLQWIDSTCLEEGAEYEVSARFKLTNMATGEPHYCDTSVWRNGNINQCPVMTLSIWTDTSSGAYHLAKTVDAGNADNWATISKIVVGNANMHNSWQAFLYLEFIPVGIDITVDDVSFARYEKDCSNVVRDGDFEDGASGSWGSVLSAPPIAIDGGYGSAGKAICLGKCGINSSGRTSRDSHIYQNLDKDCILPNVEYVITAKVKLLDQDTQQPVGCNPNMINGAEACPFADIATDANGEWRGRVVGAVVGADDDSWYMLSGVFMFYDWDLPGNTLQLRFYRAPALVDMVVDDISISLRDSSFLA